MGTGGGRPQTAGGSSSRVETRGGWEARPAGGGLLKGLAYRVRVEELRLHPLEDGEPFLKKQRSLWSILSFKKSSFGTSLAVQWLRLHASTAGHTGLIPGRGTKIPHAVWDGQKKLIN